MPVFIRTCYIHSMTSIYIHMYVHTCVYITCLHILFRNDFILVMLMMMMIIGA